MSVQDRIGSSRRFLAYGIAFCLAFAIGFNSSAQGEPQASPPAAKPDVAADPPAAPEAETPPPKPEPDWTDIDSWVGPLAEGGVKFNLRARYSHADFAGLKRSNVGTVRTRLGYGSKPLFGLSGFVEMENIVAIDNGAYFDAIAPNTRGRSVIADVEDTEVNQAYVKFQRKDWLGLNAIVGRQRIKLDDDRWIGNVGWRQNEQTYDAGRIQTTLGLEGLLLEYAYLDDVRRIFGDEGLPGAGTRDFESNSHLARAEFTVASWLKVVGFTYILDIRTAPVFSTNTFGGRITGNVPINEDWSVAYQGSYAFQTDGGTSGGTNPVNFGVHYVYGEIAPRFGPLGAIGIGYELLGSDNGTARLTTPLSTAHKFNGFADVFLNNGGVNGLQDVYAFIAPNLPWGFKGKVIFHQFYSHHRTRDLGHEVNAVVTRKIGKYITLLGKYGYFHQHRRAPGLANRVRWTAELNFAF
ncbi:MAG: alginate export family protein [Myxococcota bacterium]